MERLFAIRKNLDLSMKFAIELLEHTLKFHGHDWQMPESIAYNELKDRLKAMDEDPALLQLVEKFGNATINQAKELCNEFEEVRGAAHLFDSYEEFENFIKTFAFDNFGDGNCKEEFYRYCAFMCDLSLLCYSTGNEDFVQYIVWIMGSYVINWIIIMHDLVEFEPYKVIDDIINENV